MHPSPKWSHSRPLVHQGVLCWTWQVFSVDSLSTCFLMAFKTETGQRDGKKSQGEKKGRETYLNKCNSATVRKIDGKHTIQRRRITGEKEQESRKIKNSVKERRNCREQENMSRRQMSRTLGWSNPVHASILWLWHNEAVAFYYTFSCSVMPIQRPLSFWCSATLTQLLWRFIFWSPLWNRLCAWIL